MIGVVKILNRKIFTQSKADYRLGGRMQLPELVVLDLVGTRIADTEQVRMSS